MELILSTDLGERFHRSTLGKFEEVKGQAVKQAENKLWERAEHLRRECIEQAVAKAKAQHAKEVRRIERAHGRQLKVSHQPVRQTDTLSEYSDCVEFVAVIRSVSV